MIQAATLRKPTVPYLKILQELSEEGRILGSFLESRHADLEIAKCLFVTLRKNWSSEKETEGKNGLEEHHCNLGYWISVLCGEISFIAFSMKEGCDC